MDEFARRREQMVERQVERRGIHDPRVLAAMRAVPREAFVDEALRELAYEDSPLPIEAGQTISQPYIVALMVEAAEVAPGDRVLEIGAGSGYAAAVMASIAREVHAIERQPALAAQARERFQRLGYANIQLREGDGTRGWPEAAPFDAILAAAGGPEVPEVLLRQLAIGGRLVMPVGEQAAQRLVKIVRTSEHTFDTRPPLGDVRFVPLIGAHGWQDDQPIHAPARANREPQPLPRLIAEAAEPLPALEDPEFGRLFDRFADARVVLLGEASHGTSEFYRARAAITRRLVEAHGFRIVAVEADWPDAAVIDRHVRHAPAHDGAEPPFERFPTWMWRNTDVDAFVGWLHAFNADRPVGDRAGFHGLDLYSLHRSIRAVVEYLDRVDPDMAREARRHYACLDAWARRPQEYGQLALHAGYAPCEQPVLEMLGGLLERRLEYAARDGAHFRDAAQNARVVRNAEAYYRAMYQSSEASWNLRDRHMFETLEHLLEAGGPDSRAVVWAHNSHIGDARQTDMGRERGELNIGQLCRERFGDRAVLIGFGTHSGTVAAASDWEAPMQVMDVVPSLPDSYERQFHASDAGRALVDLRDGEHPTLRNALMEDRLERFIGVIYRPDTERWSHYAQATLPRQFDAFTWFDRTTAVTPLPSRPRRGGAPETWPFSL